MRTSKGEQKVASLLKRNGIPFKTEIMFKGLVGKKHIQLRYDFAIIKNNKVFILIEVDRVKNKFALINNIPLIRIPYWDLDTLTFEKIFNTSEYRVKSKYHLDYLRNRRC